MKIFASLMTALLLFGASTPVARADDTTVNIEYFYDALSPYGDWVEVEGYGYAFQPFVTVDDPEWRPYTDGHWAYTDAGWTWVSNEDFGWATYHYGRWMRVSNVWLWVPGDVWAPAWVSWRYSPEYVGWAPLPPEAVWQQDAGFSVAVDTAYDIGPAYYSFVAIRHFGAPRLRTYVEPWHRNVDFIRWTDNCTHITYRDSDVRVRNIYVGGPDYVEINRYSERPLRRMTLRRDDTFDARDRDRDRRSLRVREEGDALVVAAPAVTLADRKAPPAEKVKAKLDKSAVDRGWRGIKSEDAGSVREKLKREVAEAKTRPGRGGPPDAPAGPEGLRTRDRSPDSTTTPGATGERAPKAIPATPGETARTLPGTDTPERGPGDRPPGASMRRPGDDTPEVRRPGRPGEAETTPDRDGRRGPGRGPDSTSRTRVPESADRPPVGPAPGAESRPEMKPKDEDSSTKPGARRSTREGETPRPGPGNTVSPAVPRPGGVPPESKRTEKVTPPTERKPDATPGQPPGAGPDRRGRSARPDTSPNENAIPKPDRSERKIDRTPDTPPAPRNVAPPAAPTPTPRPEIRRPEPPREDMRRRPEVSESPRGPSARPERAQQPPQAPKPERAEAPRPPGPPPGAGAAGGAGAAKEKGEKKDEDEKGRRGR